MALSKLQNGKVIEVSYTEESTNFSRLVTLVVSVGTLALRTQFDKIYSPAFLCYVLQEDSICSELNELKARGIINAKQWTQLYPAVPSRVSSETFDISLLMVLLRNICCLDAPSKGWNSFPLETDHSISADITRVKFCRDKIPGHSHVASIDNIKFQEYWKILTESLVRLLGDSYRCEIEKLKRKSIDPCMEEKYKEIKQERQDEEERYNENDQDAIYYAEALRDNKSLEKTSFMRRQMGDRGARSFAEALKVNMTLKHLDLSENRINNDGATAIADALRKNCTLKCLNLSRNNIGDEGANALANALLENKSLAELDMRNNELGVNGCTHFSKLLKTTTTLKSLLF